MTDPYEKLGIQESATDEQVKKAYRELAKKYHPDNYADSPLADLAQEKMQEINEAFDAIMDQRRSSSEESRQSGSANQGYSKADPDSSDFYDVRKMIRENRIIEAEEVLDGIAQGSRNAEWYFLKGTIYFSRGWLDDATNYFSTACRMSPDNQEYKSALNNVMWQRRGNFGTQGNGQYRGQGDTTPVCGPCDICTGLLCADCCCGCLGGRGC